MRNPQIKQRLTHLADGVFLMCSQTTISKTNRRLAVVLAASALIASGCSGLFDDGTSQGSLSSTSGEGTAVQNDESESIDGQVLEGPGAEDESTDDPTASEDEEVPGLQELQLEGFGQVLETSQDIAEGVPFELSLEALEAAGYTAEYIERGLEALSQAEQLPECMDIIYVEDEGEEWTHITMEDCPTVNGGTVNGMINAHWNEPSLEAEAAGIIVCENVEVAFGLGLAWDDVNSGDAPEAVYSLTIHATDQTYGDGPTLVIDEALLHVQGPSPTRFVYAIPEDSAHYANEDSTLDFGMAVSIEETDEGCVARGQFTGVYNNPSEELVIDVSRSEFEAEEGRLAASLSYDLYSGEDFVLNVEEYAFVLSDEGVQGVLAFEAVGPIYGLGTTGIQFAGDGNVFVVDGPFAASVAGIVYTGAFQEITFPHGSAVPNGGMLNVEHDGIFKATEKNAHFQSNTPETGWVHVQTVQLNKLTGATTDEWTCENLNSDEQRESTSGEYCE